MEIIQMDMVRNAFGFIFLCLSSLLANTAIAAPISQTRSVTLYEPVANQWEIERPDVFRDRVKLAKKTGFNAVWLIVLWDRLDPVPSALGEIPLIDCALQANAAEYQCALEKAMSAVRQEDMDVFISLNYASGAASKEFTNALRGEILVLGDGPAKLYRYARYMARLASRNDLSSSVRILIHDEGILGPYRSLWNYPDAQQSFRNYLYGLNPSLTYWNSRWGLTGAQALQSWASVQTFSLNDSPASSQQLQDHISWVNWTFRQTLGSGALESTIRQIIPGATVGFHSTYFSLVNPNGPASHAPQTPAGYYSTFNFISTPYYDGPGQPENNFNARLDFAKTFFENRQLLIGELGSMDCRYPSDCQTIGSAHKVSLRVKRQQANFLAQAANTLKAQGMGYNVWSLNEFPFANKEGSFGIYEATPGSTNSADAPLFKPAACALRTVMGSSSQSLCLAFGGINNQYNPRAIWLSGRGFQSGAQIRLSNESGSMTYGTLVPVVVGSTSNLSFQLGDAIFSQLGCGQGTSNCSIAVEVMDPQTGAWSNKVLVQVN